MESSGITSIRHNIGFQWNLNLKEIRQNSSSVRGGKQSHKIIRSNQFGIGYVCFYLEFIASERPHIVVKGSSKWSFQLIYAFAVLKERVFLIEKSKKLEFLDFLELHHLDFEDEVSFHCMILAQPTVGSDGVKPNLQDLAEKQPITKQQHVDFKATEYSKYIDGEIPDFTIENAKEIIINKGTNKVMKALALEYIMKNLSANNVSGILEVSIDQGITVLQKKCADFLNRKCAVQLSLIQVEDLSQFVKELVRQVKKYLIRLIVIPIYVLGFLFLMMIFFKVIGNAH